MKDKKPDKNSEIWLKYCEECVKIGISSSKKEGESKTPDRNPSESKDNDDFLVDIDRKS